jgi:hypothetical protein
MWQKELFFSGGGQGLVDIRERLVHLLVFYYNTVYAEKPDRLNTQIKNDARQRVFVVGQ